MTRTAPALLAAALTVSTPALANAAEPLKVVATFSIIGDFAKQVGGDLVELTTLVGPGDDAHVYEPRPSDAVAMQRAQVILANGLHFEGFLERLVETSGAKASVAYLTDGVQTRKLAEDDHAEEDIDADEDGHAHEGHIDPHAFQSAANARIYVQNIANAFCAADPADCDAYKANAVRYSASLDALDGEIRQLIGTIPQDRRTVITSHDAFGYFADAYGVRFLAPEGLSTDAEASAADVAALVSQIREDKASAIFVENVKNATLIRQIAAETGLTVGGTLYSDALSDGPPAATYIDLMRHNAHTITSAIVGS